MAHRPIVDNSVNGVRSKQNLSCNWTGSADFGRIIPIHWEELVAGDHVITCKPRIEMQLLPLASPTFGKIDLYCHYFVVPIRQLWDKFYDVWSRTGVNQIATFPHFTPKSLAQIYQTSTTDAQKRAMFKHWTSLGLNPFFTLTYSGITDTLTPISWFPFAAYNKIWWDFYRDPELVSDASISSYCFTGDINGTMPSQTSFAINYMYPRVRSIKNCWISDLFARQGDFGDSAVFGQYDPLHYNDVNESPVTYSDSDFGTQLLDEDSGTTEPDFATARMQRLIESLTRLSERLSLSGKRQIEQLFARYGVKPNWAKMNLARYVGGAKSVVVVDNIISNADTASDTGGSPLGAKAGTGYCAMNDLNIEVSVDEPSILMGVVSVMPHVHFVQGLSKKWQRKYLTDMFQDSLQYVGQVAVAKREVAKKYDSVISYDQSKDGETFAFCDPYYEYKMGLDILAGDFMKYHNTSTTSLDPVAANDIHYMQSMEQYVDFPLNRQFTLNNMLVDGDPFNKIFSYLGGSVFEDVDDHFHLCIDKEVVIDRPMDGFAVPTLETTSDPHKVKQQLSQDKML